MAFLRPLRLDAGDRVTLSVEIDGQARRRAMPRDLAAALNETPGARQAYTQLPPSHRREFIEWVNGAKKIETRRRRIQKAVVMVLEQLERREQKSSGRFL